MEDGWPFILMHSAKCSGKNYKDRQEQTASKLKSIYKMRFRYEKDKETETDTQYLLVYTELALNRFPCMP